MVLVSDICPEIQTWKGKPLKNKKEQATTSIVRPQAVAYNEKLHY